MATSSDFLHDYPCSPCLEEDINKEASVFCVDCSEYFCKSCFKYHNRVAEARAHHVLEKDDFHLAAKLPKKTEKPTMPTEKCTKHHGKLVDMLCEDHDVVCCTACIATEHRPCKSIVYIPDVADARLTDTFIQDIKKDLTQELDKLKTLKQLRQHHKSRIEHEKDSCLDKVRDPEIKKAINRYLDKIQNERFKDITNTFTGFNSKIEDDIKTCDEAIAALDTINHKLEKSSKANAPQTYVNLRHAEQCIKEANGKLCDVNKNRNDLQTITLEKARPINKVMSPDNVVMSPDNVFGILHSGYMTHQSLVETENVNIKCSSDTQVCYSEDLCQLPDATII